MCGCNKRSFQQIKLKMNNQQARRRQQNQQQNAHVVGENNQPVVAPAKGMWRKRQMQRQRQMQLFARMLNRR